MKIYVAGPMRGVPEFNFPAFNAAAEQLRADGHEVFNPAEKDNERHGVDISKGNATGDEAQATTQHGFNLREALGDDLRWICAEAEAIALLPGWQNSKGAKAEYCTAVALGLQVIVLEIEDDHEAKLSRMRADFLAHLALVSSPPARFVGN